MKIENFKLKIYCLFFSLLGFLFTVQTVNAASLSLSIDPPVTVINILPAATASSQIYIRNKGDKQITLQIQLKPFKAKGEGGKLEYLQDVSPILNNIQVLDADIPVQKIILNPQQQKNLNLKISLPQNTKISDYYFSVVFISTGTMQVESSSSVNRIGVATHVLLSIGPKETSKVFLEEFSSSIFLEKGPIPFTVRIKNVGTHLIKPKGKIIIKNIFGQNVEKIDLLKVNILCDTIRVIPTTPSNNNFLLGFYTGTLNISVSDNGPAVTKTTWFLVFPVRTLIIVIIMMIAIITTTSKIRQYANKGRN